MSKRFSFNGTSDGVPDAAPDGALDGTPDGALDGAPDGASDGAVSSSESSFYSGEWSSITTENRDMLEITKCMPAAPTRKQKDRSRDHPSSSPRAYRDVHFLPHWGRVRLDQTQIILVDTKEISSLRQSAEVGDQFEVKERPLSAQPPHVTVRCTCR